MSKPVAWVRPQTLEWYRSGPSGAKADVSSIDMAITPFGEYQAPLYAKSPDADLIEALDACEDYFDSRADADCDQDGYIPNTEMRLLMLVREAIGKACA